MMRAAALPVRPDDHAARRERALADGVKRVASELRLIDAMDLIAFVRTENHPNIGDLVNSSAELSFKEGTLSYGWAADAELNWDGEPTIMLDMEFRHSGVTAFFKLVLESEQAGIDLHFISFDDPSPDPVENTSHLVAALSDAQLAPMTAV